MIIKAGVWLMLSPYSKQKLLDMFSNKKEKQQAQQSSLQIENIR